MRNTIHDCESHVARWRASGLSRSAYCRTTGLRYQTFYGWTRSIAAAAPPSESGDDGFIEVSRSVPAVSAAQAASVSIQLACGTMMHVRLDTDPSWVGSLAAAVRRC